MGGLFTKIIRKWVDIRKLFKEIHQRFCMNVSPTFQNDSRLNLQNDYQREGLELLICWVAEIPRIYQSRPCNIILLKKALCYLCNDKFNSFIT